MTVSHSKFYQKEFCALRTHSLSTLIHSNPIHSTPLHSTPLHSTTRNMTNVCQKSDPSSPPTPDHSPHFANAIVSSPKREGAPHPSSSSPKNPAIRSESMFPTVESRKKSHRSFRRSIVPYRNGLVVNSSCTRRI